MKSLIYFSIFALLIISLPLAAQGEDPMAPSIHKLNQEELDDRLKERINSDHEYYMEVDTMPVVLKRSPKNPAKLHVKGRGSLNHVEIYAGLEDEYPILSRTFRGVHFEFIDLSQLKDGEYQIRIISNHRDTETSLTLSTVEEK
jgi:hypothetical protein